MCGFALTPQGGPPTVPTGPYSTPPPVAPMGQVPPLPPPQEYPVQEAPRQYAAPSVLQALRVGRPAKWQFWTGLVLLLIALLCCPCSLGVLIFGSDALADPGGFIAQILLLGGCFFVVALALSIVLMIVGRPRRMQ